MSPSEKAQARFKELAAEAVRLVSRTAITLMERSPPNLAVVRDFHCRGASETQLARYYQPLADMPPGPGLLFFHGGGFLADSVETHDSLCRHLALTSGVRVVSVNYRLAPQHLFPSAYDDALAIWDDLAEKAAELDILPEALAVGGDSAGGNLAAGVALARPTARLLLLYPWLTLTVENLPSPNLKEGSLVGRSLRDLCALSYLGPEWQALATDPRASPLLAENLSKIKGADILTGGWDPVRPDGALFADRLRAAGIDVTLEHFDDLVHGGLSFPSSSSLAGRALDRMARALGRGLGVITPE
ncbi:alpha/beta hydrolase [Aquidulcibacter sp.]|uniref:alpha/beta hydrolase n=1 Tax=Aquidulcibacter sp. TaxID=2052990 RepID=UPI0025B9BC4D|nr:alpha/beta hydrolase [Aquidulcibacter sp.]MCA3697905.1 alpha/beta hydrolase [Aquidulcibacter sp.]